MDESQGISILVLTGNQDDVETVNSAMRDAGQAAHCQWIASSEQYSKALKSDTVELVLLNTDEYSESVQQTVKLKERYVPEVPVIVIGDTVDEPKIQSIMREGAADLISLSNKARLQSVVLRELRACRIERALNSTLNSATVYRKQLNDYMQGSSFAIALVQEGIITSVNNSWLALFKARSHDEVVGLPLMDNFESESRAAIKGAIVATEDGKWRLGEQLTVKSRTRGKQVRELKVEFRLGEFDDAPCVQVRIAPPDKSPEDSTKLVHDALKRDPTTLFYHRSQFVELMQRRLKRKPKSGLYLLAYIKPDNFSDIKDKVGMLASEDVLAAFSERLRKRFHPRDIAGRFEGTTIVALLHRGSERDGAVWAKQLVQHVNAQELRVNGRKLAITCTVGVCAATDVYSSIDELLTAAAEAHTNGKNRGGNTASLARSAKEDTRMRKHDEIWVKRIKTAMMENRFRLAQLPIAGLRSDSLSMCDMLVRMLDEQNGTILPSDFLPAAERNNLMKSLDRWIISASASYCDGNSADRVFVRLSKQSIQDDSLVEWMRETFQRKMFEPERMCLQISEQDAARYIKKTKVTVERLREIGVAFALEHYGVEKNRIQILDILKPDYIKIDGELMHSLTTDPEMQNKVRAVASAAKDRNIETIAERVENANAMAVLFQLGVHYMQGHYVCEPEVVLEDTANAAPTTLEEIGSS